MNSTFPRLGDARVWPRAVLLLVLLACTWLLPGRAMAQNACWIGGGSIAFGTVSGAGTTTSSSLMYTCNNDSNATRSYRLCLYMNPNTGSQVAPRRLVHDWPVDYLDYDLYADSAMTQLIGSSTSGHAVYNVSFTMNPRSQTTVALPIYGRVPGGQAVTAGQYYGYITEVLRWVSQSGADAPSTAQCVASASQASNSTHVTANFADTCYVSAASDMDFGSAANLATARDQTSSISLRCPRNTRWQLALSYGNHSTGGTNRRMQGPGGNYLNYQLYRNAGRTQVWGNSTSNDRAGRGNNSIQTYTVYGRVPAQTVNSAGTYSDTIIVTLTY